MPKRKRIVINTGPVLALVAAWGELDILRELYAQVIVPYEVSQEIFAGGPAEFGVKEFEQANWLIKRKTPTNISTYLSNSLDIGEASVIQIAIDENIQRVCIDETTGRRIARLHNLKLTGSVGILVRAKNEGFSFSMIEAIQKMKQNGVWLSDEVVEFALSE
jgi:predicted nucleic acid-binding protein